MRAILLAMSLLWWRCGAMPEDAGPRCERPDGGSWRGPCPGTLVIVTDDCGWWQRCEFADAG